MDGGEWLAGISIALLTLVSEDAAVIGGGVLAAMGRIQWSTAFLAGFFGVWIGDLGLYALARLFGRNAVDRILRDRERSKQRLALSQAWFERRGWFALCLCRMVPGTRLPTYLTAGLLRMPLGRFAIITGLLALVWVGVVLIIVKQVGEGAPMLLEMQRVPLAFIAVGLLGVALLWWFRRSVIAALTRFLQWEFWPAPVFYFPIALWLIVLAIRHRSFTVPTCANPGMFTGGMIGESKMETLLDLEKTSPDWVAQGFLIPTGTLEERISIMEKGMEARHLDYPIVLKPDVGQRGSGFRLVRSQQVAIEVLSGADELLIAQEYLPGPHEAGVFYYRWPGAAHGHIYSITKKVFPVLIGDGQRTVEALIREDPRAHRMASVYLVRFADKRNWIPPEGEVLRLVDAGNHAQGCVFKDGAEWITPALSERFDMISQKVNGFFIGRYDVRFSDPDAFQRGENFRILELNGAASESTNAYDAGNSLFRAYSILFKQWSMVFAIGEANRRLGVKPTPWRVLFNEWVAYQKKSRRRSIAD
jgi:membrane protein DedA with SNARE-associated domain